MLFNDGKWNGNHGCPQAYPDFKKSGVLKTENSDDYKTVNCIQIG